MRVKVIFIDKWKEGAKLRKKFFYCRSLSSPILFDDAIISFLTGIVQKKRAAELSTKLCSFPMYVVVLYNNYFYKIVMTMLLHLRIRTHFCAKEY